MGNRAVIQFGDDTPETPALGVYLHWNGGVESVTAFLDYASSQGVPNDDYGVARLAQIIGNFFGGTSSVGVGLARVLDRDNYDNGTYIVKDWKIVSRLYNRYDDQPFDPAYYEGVLAGVKDTNDPIFTKTP